MKIKELVVGKSYTITLVVISATVRETKAKKPFLALEFYDGEDKINGNYWDWGGKSIPEKNMILDVETQVTEWQNAKQLNIRKLTTNNSIHLSEFMPSSGLDIAKVYMDAYELASNIDNPAFTSLCLGVLDDLRELWLSAPAANSMHHAYAAGTLIHSLSVARLAKAMAETIPGADVALATAGGLLHDIGKLFGYRIDGIICEMTDIGMLHEHLFLGAEFVGNYATKIGVPIDKIELIRHIILSHHGKQEHGAVVTPAFIEAHIVFHADTMDANAEMIRVASSKAQRAMWTAKIWALDNKPHLTTNYVQEVMLSRP